MTFTFTARNSAISSETIAEQLGDFERAINLAVNLATSESAFPVHWKTGTTPGDSPSYVNVQASGSARVVSAITSENKTLVYVTMELSDVLSAFEREVNSGVRGNVSTYLEYALTSTGLFGQVDDVFDAEVEW